MKRRIDIITAKLQVVAREKRNFNEYEFCGCTTTSDVLFKLGAGYWSVVLSTEGYSTKYCNSDIKKRSKRFLALVDKVIKKWDEINPELTKKLINKETI